MFPSEFSHCGIQSFGVLALLQSTRYKQYSQLFLLLLFFQTHISQFEKAFVLDEKTKAVIYNTEVLVHLNSKCNQKNSPEVLVSINFSRKQNLHQFKKTSHFIWL